MSPQVPGRDPAEEPSHLAGTRPKGDDGGLVADDAGITRVSLDLLDAYRFKVDLGRSLEPVIMDEPPPLGAGSGPNASALLAAAVGNCLSASLLYCLRRSHIEVTALHSEVKLKQVRNQAGRLRIGMLVVVLKVVVAPGSEGRISRCLELFEDFCVVTQSVRQGIDVDVDVDVQAPLPEKT